MRLASVESRAALGILIAAICAINVLWIRISAAPPRMYDDSVYLADSVHRDIRQLGGIAPPRAFVFMDRAAIGLGSVFLHLKARINWHSLFHELIDDFDERVLARRQKAALAKAGVPQPQDG